MLEVGKVCLKIAGRDAGKIAVIVDVLEEPFVLIDGEVRRKKCNIKHLEPLDRNVDVKKGASHNEVLKALGLTESKKGPKKETKTLRQRKIKGAKKYAEPKKKK
jgi:large subunit ribosomal protein L14e